MRAAFSPACATPIVDVDHRSCDTTRRTLWDSSALLRAGGRAIASGADRAAERRAAIAARSELALRHDAVGDAIAFARRARARAVLRAVARVLIADAIPLPRDAAGDGVGRLAARGAHGGLAHARDAGAGQGSAVALAVGSRLARAQVAQLPRDAADVGVVARRGSARTGGVELRLYG